MIQGNSPYRATPGTAPLSFLTSLTTRVYGSSPPEHGFRHTDVGIGARAGAGRPPDGGRRPTRCKRRRRPTRCRSSTPCSPAAASTRASLAAFCAETFGYPLMDLQTLQRRRAAAESHRRQADAGAARDRAGQARQQAVGRHLGPDQYPGPRPDQVPERSLGRAGDRRRTTPCSPCCARLMQERRAEPAANWPATTRTSSSPRKTRRPRCAGRRPTTSKTRRSSSSSTRS